MKGTDQISTQTTFPDGWGFCRLEDVVLSQKGKRPQKLSEERFEGSVPYLDIKAIETGRYDNYADEISSVIIGEKELVVVWDGSRSGWVGKGRSGALGSTLVALTPVLVDYNFLYYFIRSKFDFINTNIKGAGIPHVNQDFFWNIQFPLPPLTEQKRIGLKLEETLQKLEPTKLAVEKVPEIILAARQKILNKAVSGELTVDWRRDNKPSNIIQDLSSHQTDANGWVKVRAEDCCIKISNGSTPKGKRFEIETGIPFLKVYNIVDQKVDFNSKPQFIDVHTHQKQKKSVAHPNDVIINIVGPPLGKVALVPNEYPEWNMNQALVLFRPKEYIRPEFLYFFLAEGTQIKSIENEYKGSAGQSNISLTQCRNFEIRVPSLAEQDEIIKRITDRYQELDVISRKSLAVTESISVSINKIIEQAFIGELSSQDGQDPGLKITIEDLKNEKIRLEKLIAEEKKKKAERKNLLMTTKKMVSLEETLKKEFGKKEFSFADIDTLTDIEYDGLRDEVYLLLNKSMRMRFDAKTEKIFFKF